MHALRYIRHALNNKLVITIGRAIILSRIDYCNALLAGATEANINRLQRVQNQLIRLVKRLSYRFHTSDCSHALYWLHIPEHVVYKLAELVYDVCATHIPAYLEELLHSHVPSMANLRSLADHTKQIISRTRTKRAKRAFSSGYSLEGVSTLRQRV